jgi:hypothetical protein
MTSLLNLQTFFDSNSRDLSPGGVFAHSDLAELEIFRHFLYGHDLGHNKIPLGKDFFIRKVMGWCFLSWLLLK